MDLDAEIDRLYGLPLDEFVPERDTAAKRLRDDGEREAAAAVKALRKPTLGAWAINQAARRRVKERDELLAAGERLRAAHEALLSGGGPGALREASRDERSLVTALADTAAAIATEGGKGGPALAERLRSTLHAAAVDDEVREELAAGRVVREREASGLGMLGETALPARGSQRRGAARSGSAGAASGGDGAAGSAAAKRSGAKRSPGGSASAADGAKDGRAGGTAKGARTGAEDGRGGGSGKRARTGAKTGRSAKGGRDAGGKREAAKRARQEAAELEREAERRELAEQLAAAEGELAEARAELDAAESTRDDAGEQLEAAREALEHARTAESDARRVAREHAKEVGRLERLVERLRVKARG